MYRLFIDEVGNSDLASAANDNERYLSLTGVIVDLDYHNGRFSNELSKFKCSIFGTDTMALHRRELSRRAAPFEVLQNEAIRQRFDNGLLALPSALAYRVITVVIDKREHSERYRVWRYHPYHYCLTVMLERYLMYLSDFGGNGDVMAESRERADNEKLVAAYNYFYNNGTDWIAPTRAKIMLTTRELKLKRKDANIAGLQVADLVAHPSFRWIQSRRLRTPMTAKFGSQVAEILYRRKYLRNPSGLVQGWGCKWLP